MGADYVEINVSAYDYKNMKELETLFYSSYRVGGNGDDHETYYTVYDVFDNIKNGLPIPFDKSVDDYEGLCHLFRNIKNGKAIPVPLTDQRYLDEFIYDEIEMKFDGKKLNDFLNRNPYFDFNKFKEKYKNHEYICILETRSMG